MADERKCYAGDLTSDALDKRVRIPGLYVSPMVSEVVHRVDSNGEKHTELEFDDGRHASLPETTVVEVLP